MRPSYCIFFVSLQTTFSAIPFANASSEQNLLNLSFEDLGRLTVEASSLFSESELEAASSVSVIEPHLWQQQGARKTLDVLEHLPSTIVLPTNSGLNVIAMRGYAQTTSARGIATTLDGVPLNNFAFGTGQYESQNINLGVLNKIEVIRGPGSALYGSDAFHGVLAFSTFESEENLTYFDTSLADNGYYQSTLQFSEGPDTNTRFNFAMALSGRPDQDINYEFAENTAVYPIDKREDYDSYTASMKISHQTLSGVKARWSIFSDTYRAKGYPASKALFDSGQETNVSLAQFHLETPLTDKQSFEINTFYRSNDANRTFVAPRTGGPLMLSADSDEYRRGGKLIFRRPFTEGRHTRLAISAGYEETALYNAIRDTTLPSGVTSVAPAGDDNESRLIKSLQFEMATRLADNRWLIQYGGRVDSYSDFGTHFTPRLTIIRTIDQGFSLKAIYGNAFRAPTSAELYSQSTNNTGNPDLKPEELDALEFSAVINRKQWGAKASIFTNRWKEGISLVPQTEGSSYENTGESESEGFELTAHLLRNHWRFDYSASHVRSRNNTNEFDYEQFPTFIFNFSAGTSRGPFSTEVYLNNRLFTQSHDVPEGSATESEKLPTFWQTDLNIVKKVSTQASTFLDVRNIFDRDNHLPSTSGVKGGIPADSLSIAFGLRLNL